MGFNRLLLVHQEDQVLFPENHPETRLHFLDDGQTRQKGYHGCTIITRAAVGVIKGRDMQLYP
jgi:hypothetical protein